MQDLKETRNAKIREIEAKLEQLDRDKKLLLLELSELQKSRTYSNELPPLYGTPASSPPASSEEKVALFLRLFRARESIFPKLWENKAKGTEGYSPACNNEWVRGVCEKPRIKCSDCSSQAFPKLDEQAVRDHLQGKFTIGTYAIREDDTCTFLAADFDGGGWPQDALAYKQAGREMGVQIEVERSRSGNGAHAWIFFSEPVSARKARQLGTAIVARAHAFRHTMSLDTYDRLFPSQDNLPKGGFGNLIALPLQKEARDKGNSVFLNDSLEPISDQWEALASARRISAIELNELLSRNVPHSFSAVQYEDESVAAAERALDSGNEKVIPGSFPGQIQIHCGAQISVNIDTMPPSILAAMKRTAIFANPKFFEMERMRFSTWKTPRFIFCGESLSDTLILPRGSLDACLEIAKTAGSSVLVRENRPKLPELKIQFQGDLSGIQKKAVTTLAKFDTGVLVAPPGAGKTVMGCALIAERKMPTLILVHRTPLLEQWRDQISKFLGIDPKQIGTFTGTRKKQTGQIDIGMLPTLANMNEAADLFAPYGHIVIDECHHIPALSFEKVSKRIPARYVLGLTATPYRKDGHQAIIHMQCGPIRYEIKEAESSKLAKRAIIRETSFRMPEDAGPQPAIHLVWERLVADPDRLDLVAEDLRTSLEAGRFPLVISERKEHLALLSKTFDEKLQGLPVKEFVLTGGMGKKARAAILSEVQAAPDAGIKPFILATGSFIGEGFDLPALDTLIIAMPVSFKGKMIQYAGRLHRANPGKKDAVIYDYLDSSSALTVSMFRKRLTAYRKMDYQIDAPPGTRASRIAAAQSPMFPFKS